MITNNGNSVGVGARDVVDVVCVVVGGVGVGRCGDVDGGVGMLVLDVHGVSLCMLLLFILTLALLVALLLTSLVLL